MSYRRHQIAIDYINLLMQFLVAYLTMAVVLYPFDHGAPLNVLILLPAPFLSYIIRRYTHYIWSFALLHLIIAVLYLVLADRIYYLTVFGIYLVVLTAISYYIRHRRRDTANTSLFLLIYFIFLYVSCYLVEMKELLPLCFSLTLLYTLLYIMNQYLLNFDRFIRNHEHMVNIPFLQIRNSSYILIAFLCFLFLLAMLGFSRISFEAVLTVLGTFCLKLLRSLILWLSRRKPEEAEWTREVEPGKAELYSEEPSKLMELLSAIFQWTITAALIIGTVALILYTIYKIYKHFYLKGEEAVRDTVEFLSPFEKKEKLKQKQHRRKGLLFGRSNNEAIRRHFAKAVLTNTGPESNLSKSLTPSQLSEYAVLQKEENSPSEQASRELITSCYEKARYSNEDCTREEVQQVKMVLKGHRNKNEYINHAR